MQIITKQRIRRAIFSIISLSALVYLQPVLWSRVAARAQQLNDQRSQEQIITATTARNTNLAAAASTRDAITTQINTVAPSAKELTKLVEEIEKLADRYLLNITIDEIKVMAAINDLAGLVPTVITVTATGLPSQLLAYLGSVEQMTQLTVVDKWNLVAGVARNVSAGKSNTHTLSMDLIFYLKP